MTLLQVSATVRIILSEPTVINVKKAIMEILGEGELVTTSACREEWSRPPRPGGSAASWRR